MTDPTTLTIAFWLLLIPGAIALGYILKWAEDRLAEERERRVRFKSALSKARYGWRGPA